MRLSRLNLLECTTVVVAVVVLVVVVILVIIVVLVIVVVLVVVRVAVIVAAHGLGKTMRVLVFAEGEAVKLAQEAGADSVGSDDLIKQIEGGWLEFDVALAQREVMGKASRLGRILGPRGLMPNPKSGTVVDAEDIPRAVREAQQGRVEFRVDKTALLHIPIGKLSFGEDKLLENMATVIEAVVKAKPSGAKGQYIRAATLSTTMGPGIKLELQPTLALSTS